MAHELTKPDPLLHTIWAFRVSPYFQPVTLNPPFFLPLQEPSHKRKVLFNLLSILRVSLSMLKPKMVTATPSPNPNSHTDPVYWRNKRHLYDGLILYEKQT